MTIPVSLFCGVICLLLSIVIHLLIRLVDGVAALKIEVAVHSADNRALEQRVKQVEKQLEHKHSQRMANA